MKRIPAITTGLMVLVLLVTACGSAAPIEAPPVTATNPPEPDPPSTVATTALTDTPVPPADTVDQPVANESGEAQATLLYFWASW